MVYLVIGNHSTLIGVWEQIEITLRTFNAMKIPISISSRVKPNETNIIIEDFNSRLVNEMFSIKENFPDTKYILYVTEYLTQGASERVTLNCFSRRAELVRKAFRWDYYICGDKYNLFLSSESAESANWIRRFVRPTLSSLATYAGSSYGNEVMMARRETCLDKVRDLFSLCISTTEAVLNGYSEYCDCELVYLPIFIDMGRVKENRTKSEKFPSMFFSGRMTASRRSVIKELGQNILNTYPLEGGEAWENPSIFKDTKFKIERLRTEEFAFGPEDSKRFSKEIEMSQFRGFWLLNEDIYSYINRGKTAAYELYVPQAISWPYSSPNRTVLSIESGFIPVDLGYFSDHDVNSISITVNNSDEISRVLTQNIEENYLQLDGRISDYNDLQAIKAQKAKVLIQQVSQHGS